MRPSQPHPQDPAPTRPLVLALCNDKGGSNRTISSLHLSAELASRGFHVLLVDLDQAGDATKSLADPHRCWTGSTGEVLSGDMPLLSAVLPTAIPTLWLLPADKQLRGFDQDLIKARPYDFVHVLAQVLTDQASGFDFVFLDCPGNLDTFTVLALVAAHAFIVPCTPEYFSLDGAKAVVEVAENLVRQGLTPNLQFSGLFFSPFNPKKQNRRWQGKVVESAKKLFPGQVFSPVRADKGIGESLIARVPLVVLDPQARAVLDFRVLTDELVTRVRQLLAQGGHHVESFRSFPTVLTSSAQAPPATACAIFTGMAPEQDPKEARRLHKPVSWPVAAAGNAVLMPEPRPAEVAQIPGVPLPPSMATPATAAGSVQKQPDQKQTFAITALNNERLIRVAYWKRKSKGDLVNAALDHYLQDFPEALDPIPTDENRAAFFDFTSSTPTNFP